MTGLDLNAWLPLTQQGDVLWMKYSFGLGTANSLAVKLKDKTWMVISPAPNAPETVYTELEKQGEVSALVAPNPYHNLGQPAWRDRYPQASSFAPQGAYKRLARKTPSVRYRPIDELTPNLASADFLHPEGMKTPDLMLRIASGPDCIWWMGDQLSNSSASDQTWALRLISRLAGGGLGCRCNSKPELVYLSDRAAWIDSVRSYLEDMPPSIVVPAHGNPISANATESVRKALDAVDKRLA